MRNLGFLLKVVRDPSSAISIDAIKDETSYSLPLRGRNHLDEGLKLQACAIEGVEKV
jgi:hypothetical protein